MNTLSREIPWRVIALFLFPTTVILVSFLLWADPIDRWIMDFIASREQNRLWVGGILFATLSSDILLPVPSSVTTTLCGLYLGFPGGFWTAFMAMNLSALAGYLIGRYAQGLARRLLGEKDMAALQKMQERSGAWLLLAMRPVPILAETSVVLAGISHTSPRRDALQLLIGNAAVSAIYVAVGAFTRDAGSDSCLPAFGLTLFLSGIFYFLSRRKARITTPAS